MTEPPNFHVQAPTAYTTPWVIQPGESVTFPTRLPHVTQVDIMQVDCVSLPVSAQLTDAPNQLHMGTRAHQQISANVRLDLVSVLPRTGIESLTPMDVFTCQVGAENPALSVGCTLVTYHGLARVERSGQWQQCVLTECGRPAAHAARLRQFFVSGVTRPRLRRWPSCMVRMPRSAVWRK